jgi:guanylate kinase
MRRGVILCGPPASGKDTITRELSQLSTRYTLFRKLKAGSGSGAAYRSATIEQIQDLKESGDVLQSSRRYGNVYAVDRPELESLFERNAIPMIHMGDIAGVRALQAYPAAWLSVLLWCPRQLTEDRLRGRGSEDIEARLAAWDEAAIDLSQSRPEDFVLRIDTPQYSIENTARIIHDQLMELPVPQLAVR